MKIVKSDEAGLKEAAQVLLAGGVAVIPTDTVYGLAAHPNFPEAVNRLYTIKGRAAAKPIAMLAADAEATGIASLHIVSEIICNLTRHWPGALTIVFGGEGYRVPDHAWTRQLLKACGGLLRVTSANMSGARAATDAETALADVGLSADLVVDDGVSRGGTASTVVKLEDSGAITVLREGPVKISNRFRALVGGALLALCASFACLADGFYVWQRQWSEPVEKAVEAELSEATHEVYLLGGELEYNGDKAQWRGPDVPSRLWHRPCVTAVLRLPVRALDDVAATVGAILSRARALGVRRLQLDVDVSESKIVRYAELVEALRRRWPDEAGSLSLGATFLPCHLGHGEVRRVLSAVDEPVIQLHGIDAPKNRAEGWALMKRETVLAALRAARDLDGRFKMALPSYAYVLTFEANGTFRRLYAEGLPDDYALPPGTIREIAAPDLGLLHEIFTSPLRLPVIWFRLPVRGVDRWCLARETLILLERGERPEPFVECSAREGERAGTVDLVARYRHQIPLEGVRVSVVWGPSDAEGEFFPMNGCRIEGSSVYGRLPTSLRLAPFACGESFLVGKAITSVNPGMIVIGEVVK